MDSGGIGSDEKHAQDHVHRPPGTDTQHAKRNVLSQMAGTTSNKAEQHSWGLSGMSQGEP